MESTTIGKREKEINNKEYIRRKASVFFDEKGEKYEK